MENEKQISILVLEDNQVNQIVFKKFIEKMGAECTLAKNGKEGIAALQVSSNNFDIIITDIQMPVLDGISFLNQAKGLNLIDAIPVIAISAEIRAHSVEKLLQIGFNDVLEKPIQFNTFKECLLKSLK